MATVAIQRLRKGVDAFHQRRMIRQLAGPPLRLGPLIAQSPKDCSDYRRAAI